ncbi:MAG: hypothetical protein AAFM92_16385 [Pseudomonadota bacterium]
MSVVARPIVIGSAMGLMLPFMLHETGGLGAVLFIAAHVAALCLIAALALLVPALRARLPQHRPSPRHMGLMGLGLALGFSVICLACPLAFGMEHPWT